MGSFAGNDEIAAAAKTYALCPGEQAVADAFGAERIERTYRPDGSYEWKMPYQANDGHGKSSKDGSKVLELMTPFWRADSDRQQEIQAKTPRVGLKDEAGSVHYVGVEAAEKTERANGWRESHRFVVYHEDRQHSRRCHQCHEHAYWCRCE